MKTMFVFFSLNHPEWERTSVCSSTVFGCTQSKEVRKTNMKEYRG